MKVIGCARVSTDAHAGEGVSLAAQKQNIRATAAVKGLSPVELIVDGGESAKNLNRPEIERLFAEGIAGGRRP